MVIHLTFLRAIVIGLLQGVTELFPISSLGHSVLLPAVLGWNDLVKGQNGESGYLAFLVGLHVATALALLAYFWRDWIRIIQGGFRSLVNRKVETSDERLFWLLVLATIPVGVIGLVLEHKLRTVFAKPTAAALFLFVNGLILLGGEKLRQRSATKASHRKLETLEYREGVAIGSLQSLALLAGISRSGVTIVAGLLRGLDHEEAAKFSFLAATPVILAAGVYKLPDLFGKLGNGIRGQVLAGSVAAAIAAYAAVRFLVRYFQTRTLTPFAIYSLVVGGVLAIGYGTGLF
ncbi:MAG: undecaprenyl-diphosphate phosphatase [Acidimicrobiales bacterium]